MRWLICRPGHTQRSREVLKHPIRPPRLRPSIIGVLPPGGPVHQWSPVNDSPKVMLPLYKRQLRDHSKVRRPWRCRVGQWHTKEAWPNLGRPFRPGLPKSMHVLYLSELATCGRWTAGASAETSVVWQHLPAPSPAASHCGVARYKGMPRSIFARFGSSSAESLAET